MGAGGLSQQLRVLFTPMENLSWVPSIYIGALYPLITSVPRDLTYSSGLWVHLHKCVYYPPTQQTHRQAHIV